MKRYLHGRICRALRVICGRCSDTGELFYTDLKYAEREARELGWSKTLADGWVCPRCLRNAGKDEQP